jgi:hypothetical protein
VGASAGASASEKRKDNNTSQQRDRDREAKDRAWLEPLSAWMEKETTARLDRMVIRIQSLVRGVLGKAYVRQIHLDIADGKRFGRHHALAAKKCQSAIRMLLGRMRGVRRAQTFLIKYDPYEGQHYWYHPSTNVTSWERPKILQSRRIVGGWPVYVYECRCVPLPPIGLEMVAKCSMCKGAHATISCKQCDDSFCRLCYDTTHARGMRLGHSPGKIPYCSYCKLQMASKYCNTCFLSKPKPGSVQEILTGHEKGFYCDSCFAEEHDEGLRVVRTIERKLADRMVVFKSRDAYLVSQQIHRQMTVKHRYDCLIALCEECNNRAAFWRCADCRQIFCGLCLMGLHNPQGPFKNHSADPLPYYTPQMHERFLNDQREQILRVRMERLQEELEMRKDRRYMRSVVVVQAWWRGIKARRQDEIRRRRRRVRIAWRARREETRKVRSRVLYQLMDFVGVAPRLETDTREEVVLKRVPFWLRHRARMFIWENQADWGHYRVSRTDPQKGVPKRGFEVGEVGDLQQQAVYGGVRLPGLIYMRPGKSSHETQYDLKGLPEETISVGCLVRVKSRVFRVEAIGERRLTLDRKWRGDLTYSKTPTPEVIYTVPSQPGQPTQYFYRSKFSLTRFAMTSLAARLAFRSQRRLWMWQASWCLGVARRCRGWGLDQAAIDWKHAAEELMRVANVADLYLESAR